MPLCQSHTTTKINAFILNLVVFSPEGERLYYSFEFTPSLEQSHVKINSYPSLLFFSTLTLIAKVTHLVYSTSHRTKSSYSQESEESGKLMWDSPRRYASHLQMCISLGWVTPMTQICNTLCWLIFSQKSDWAINLQTQPHNPICHEHRMWFWGDRNYTQFKSHKVLTLDLWHNLLLVSYSSSWNQGDATSSSSASLTPCMAQKNV